MVSRYAGSPPLADREPPIHLAHLGWVEYLERKRGVRGRFLRGESASPISEVLRPATAAVHARRRTACPYSTYRNSWRPIHRPTWRRYDGFDTAKRLGGTMHACTFCGARGWLQIAADGDRHALREIHLEGLQARFGAWRMPARGENVPAGKRFVCVSCREPVSADMEEALATTRGVDDVPVVFVAPDQVDLDAVVARLRRIYGEHVLAVLESDRARPAQCEPLSRLKDLHPSVAEAVRRKLRASNPELYLHQLQAIEHARAGRNVILATATASGKSLCFQLRGWTRSLEVKRTIAQLRSISVRSTHSLTTSFDHSARSERRLRRSPHRDPQKHSAFSPRSA